MATNTNNNPGIAPGPVSFSSASFGSPDVRITVFNKVFHVHSQILQEYIPFFRTFLTSPDKAGQPLPASGFKYDWVTKVDFDGTGWGPVNNDSKAAPLNLALFTGSPEEEQIKFEKLLNAAYRQPFTIGSLDELVSLVEVFRFYMALPLLSASISAVLQSLADPIALIMENPSAALRAAVDMRCIELYQDTLLLAIGQLHAPDFKVNEFHNPQLLQKLESASEKLFRTVYDTQHAITTGLGVEEGDSFTIACSHFKRRSDESIRDYQEVFWPYVARKLYDIDYTGIPFLQSTMEPLMRNSLRLDRLHRKSGAGEFTRYFLCADFDDADVPWDRNERDW